MIGFQMANQLRVASSGANQSSSLRNHLTNDSSPSPSPSPKLSSQLEASSSSFNQHEDSIISRNMIKRECEANSLADSRYSDPSASNSNNNILLDKKSPTQQQQDHHQHHTISAHLLHHQHQHHNLLNQHHHNQHHHHHHHNHPSTSPGYHSAASSPCSTADSPVSSSSSSGVSSASSVSNTNVNCSNNQQTITSKSLVSQPSMHQHNPSTANLQSAVAPFHLLDYLPELNNDGLNLTWAHEANSRAKLNEALSSSKIIISGDIALAEMSRYPVPIMARAPVGISDLTLENWLQEVTQAPGVKRAIKLTFSSTRTVEPAFRVLARHAEALKGPLILSADILAPTNNNSASTNGGNGNKTNKQQQQQQDQNSANQPVDAWTFLMMCRTRFPKCTISIGWCPTDLDEPTMAQQLPMLAPNAPQNNGTKCQFHQQSTDNQSIFDLDIMLDSHSALSQLVEVSHLGHLQQQLNQHQQNRIHHQLNSYPLIHHRNQLIQQNQHLHRQHHHQHNHLVAHQLISSAGSMGSSSGNSSGSPSPTSPINQLLTPPTYQMVAANLSLSGPKSATNQQQASQLDPTEQLILNACAARMDHQPANGDASAAAAAAAAMTAAIVAASTLHQQQHQQLPLNLNINEAADHQQSNGTINRKHQSFPSSQQNIAQITNDSLASRLFGSSSNNNNNCTHIQKKLNMGTHSVAISGSCSPQSTTSSSCDASRRRTSPKLLQRLQPDANLLLKTTIGQQQTLQPQQPILSGGGYTREMIDKMASLVKEYNLTQPVTFPVEARCLMRNQSLSELQRLLYQVGSNSTLTIVVQQDDLISVDDLLLIRRSFAANQLLFDIPERLAVALRRELD